MKKTFILTMALSAMALVSCGDDKKDEDSEESKKETNEQKVAKIACGCAEEGLKVLDGEDAASMEGMQAVQEAYIDCAMEHMEEMKKLQIDNDKMMKEMEKMCPDAAKAMEKMREAM